MSLLETIAADIGKWFPELNGRSVAVTDAQINKQNLPTLPLVMVALANEVTARGRTAAVNLSQRSQFEVIDTFVVEFWVKPNRYTTQNGAETPFWAFYDYEAIRNRLLTGFSRYIGPNGERISYVGFTIQGDEFAVVISFDFLAHYNWCPNDEPLEDLLDGQPIGDNTFLVNVCQPKNVCFETQPPDETPLDDCDRRATEAAQREQASKP